jgi:ABC-type polysaccharide/polyol phosphate transport system ATPase subunit
LKQLKENLLMSSEPVIALNNVWKKYSRSKIFHRSLREDIANIFEIRKDKTSLAANEFWALQDINLSIPKGETVGLYGPNGSGKSTILKLIAKVTYPSLGTVAVSGTVAPLLEIGAGFHKDLTGRENIFINGAILGMKINDIKKRIDSIIDFAEVKEFIDMPVKNYSSGMYVRLAFSIAIHSRADIYLFDEIIAVGDSNFKEKCLERIKQLKDSEKTLLIVSHNYDFLKKSASRIIQINKGGIA